MAQGDVVVFIIPLLFSMLIGNQPVFAAGESESRFRPSLDQAWSAQKADDHNQAVKLFKKVYRKSDTLRAEALKGLVASLRALKRPDEAADIIKSEIERNPFSGELKLLLCETLQDQGRHQEAYGQVLLAEKILGNDPRLLLLKSQLETKLGKFAEAIQSLTAYIKLNPKDFSALLARAECYLQLGQSANASLDLHWAHELRPYEEKVLVSVTKAALSNKNYAETKEIGKKCTEIYPKNEFCHAYLGKAFFQQKDYAMAIQQFKSSLQLNPEQDDLKLPLAEALALKGDWQESYGYYRDILDRHPNDEAALRSWVDQLARKNEIELMGSVLKTFCQKSPGNIWAHIELAKLLAKVGATEEAFSTLKKLVSKNSSLNAKLYESYMLYIWGKMESSFTSLSDLKGDDENVLFNKGIVAFKLKKNEEALANWKKITKSPALAQKALSNIAFLQEERKSTELRKPAMTPSSNLNLEWSLPQL